MKHHRLPQKDTLPEKKRFLFFDLFRIACVAIIIYVHSQFFAIPYFNNFFFSGGAGPFNIYSLGLQGFAVFGLIFSAVPCLSAITRVLKKLGDILILYINDPSVFILHSGLA